MFSFRTVLFCEKARGGNPTLQSQHAALTSPQLLWSVFVFRFTFETCPDFKWKWIKVSCQSQAGSTPLQWPTCTGLKQNLCFYCTEPSAVAPCCAWRQAAKLWAEAELLSFGLSESQAAGERKREWSLVGYANCTTTKGEGEDFPTGWVWKSSTLLPLTMTLNGTLSFDTHWPACTQIPHKLTHE